MDRRSTGLFQTWRPDRPRESAFADRVRPDEACSLEAHGQALVVGVEDELLGGGGAVEAMAGGWQHVLTRPPPESLRFSSSREDLDPLVNVDELFGDGGHVDGVPAAGLVGVEDHDRQFRADQEVA